MTTTCSSWRLDSGWTGLQQAAARIRIGRSMGIQALDDGRIVIFHEGDPALLVFAPDGRLLDAVGGAWRGAHGCSRVVEDGEERLWLTDRHDGRVEQWSLDGRRRRSLSPPPLDVYREPRPDGKPSWQPTWVAVAPDASIWVADGYGSSRLHRYSARGRHEASWDGSEHAELGRFACPHGISWDLRGEEPLLAVTDRGRGRLRWLDAEGRLRHVVAELCHSPCAFAFAGELMAIPEMRTGVKLCHGRDRLLAELGANPAVLERREDAGVIHPDRCVFPHAACWLDGVCWVVEGVDGGRVVRIRPDSA